LRAACSPACPRPSSAVGGVVEERASCYCCDGSASLPRRSRCFRNLEFNSPSPGTRRTARFGLLVLKSEISEPKSYRRTSWADGHIFMVEDEGGHGWLIRVLQILAAQQLEIHVENKHLDASTEIGDQDPEAALNDNRIRQLEYMSYRNVWWS
jgi:hypothetical protein